MGLFTPKPYKMNVLSDVEKSAAISALEVGIFCAKEKPEIAAALARTKKRFGRGALTQEDLYIVVGCLKGSLKALKENEEDNLQSSLLKKKAVVEVAMELALEKLEAMA